ncbi:MAG: alpha/beta hydrolase [Bacteroidetes bacterium]|nr:alpha/beta hydrolase [Bacteroidota bacterium]
MQKKSLWAIPVLLIIIYLAGPAPAKPVYKTEMPVVPADALQLEAYVKNNEAQHKIKPDNEARIIWFNDSSKQKTDYAIVYLHGFSASQGEGDPVHKNIAKEFGCNLYLSRLAEHGIDTVDAMINLTADKYWESAKQALAIGKQLGRKVILMSTSTGGTNALQLAAAYPDDVAALILLSPNIEINDPNAWLLNNHWGLQIAHLVLKSDFIDAKDNRPIYKQYWDWHYRAEAAVALQELLETTMTKETFEKVKQPVELLYFYKDEAHQDSVVKVPAMLKMYDELGTPDSLKRKQAIPNAGTHVIGSYIKSHDVEGVQKEIEKFMIDVLHIKKVNE